MKKILSLGIIAALMFSLVACTTQKTVEAPAEETAPQAEGLAPHPMQHKEYVPTQGATPEELREIAVEVMLDSLTIQWNTDHFFYYNKQVGLTHKKYTFSPGNVFGGIPYTDGSSGVIQWMEFYDKESGLFSWDGSGQELEVILGNSCAGNVISAWNAVCNSMPKCGITKWMTQANGCLPVGPYTYDPQLTNLDDYTTDRICEDNGKEIMFQSYAEIRPADGLVSNPDAHAIMARYAAHVEYLEDGSIDGEKSYVVIMDQRAGDGKYFYVEMDGETEILHSGRTYAEYTFEELWELCYIPCCPAEFKGLDPYETPEVTYSGNTPATVEDLLAGSVVSNYPIAVARLSLISPDGEEVVLDRYLARNHDIGHGKAKNFPCIDLVEGLSQQEYLDAVASGEDYSLRIVVILYNGQIYNMAEVPVG